MIIEGQGFTIQAARDSPWAGWFSLQEQDWIYQIKTNPSIFLRHLGEIIAVLPGGISVLWDAPEISHQCDPALLATLEGILANLPGLNLHINKPLHSEHIEAPLNVWLHSPVVPNGELGILWRKGIIGWVPQTQAAWHLPGFGCVTTDHDDSVCRMLWGEVTIPASALRYINLETLRLAIEDTQAQIERAFSLRMNAGAWPQSIPFQRRKTAWRLTLTGGCEYQVSGHSWEELAADFSSLRDNLSNRLKCPVHPGINHDAGIARLLGEQAMRLGLPWRNTLNLPPAPSGFTPGIAADPRKTSPLQARTLFPEPLVRLLSDPPQALLRIPAVPSQEGTNFFIRSLETPPAIRWLPPNMPPSGPFHTDIPWDNENDFPVISDAEVSQPKLFDWTD